MGELIVQILTLLQNFSPIATIALLGVVLFMMAKNAGNQSTKLNTITDNHLHGLPEMMEALSRIESKLETMNNNLQYLVGKLNGGPR